MMNPENLCHISDHINKCRENVHKNDLSELKYYEPSDIQRVNIFYFVSNKAPWSEDRDAMALDKRQIVCLETEIAEYYTDEKIRNILVPVLSQRGIKGSEGGAKSHRISLRLLDWLVCNYSKNKSVHFIHPTRRVPINIFSLYKKFLRGYKRNLFDPFRRKALVVFTFDGKLYNTTVGQLNFLKFCDHYGILSYANEHHDSIEKDMVAALGRSKLIKKLTKAKRIKLSKPSDIQIQCNSLKF